MTVAHLPPALSHASGSGWWRGGGVIKEGNWEAKSSTFLYRVALPAHRLHQSVQTLNICPFIKGGGVNVPHRKIPAREASTLGLVTNAIQKGFLLNLISSLHPSSAHFLLFIENKCKYREPRGTSRGGTIWGSCLNLAGVSQPYMRGDLCIGLIIHTQT